MANFKEAGEKLGQFCVACGWHNVTFEVAEIEPTDEGRNVAFALFVEKKDGDSKKIVAFFDCSGVQPEMTNFIDHLSEAFQNKKYGIPDFAGQTG